MKRYEAAGQAELALEDDIDKFAAKPVGADRQIGKIFLFKKRFSPKL
ncbi:hypothetical protein NXV87_06125 [Bacteroides fragilis]|nr:hypothetical protein [Bacteroides fragilis]